MTDETAPREPGLSRRGLFGLAGAGLAGAAVGFGSGHALHTANPSDADRRDSIRYDFYGRHQAGIVTPVQDQLHFAVFDLREGADRDTLIGLLRDWTTAAAKLTQGLEIGDTGADGGSYNAPPDDTGEAIALKPAGLTITLGFGPALFQTATGEDRFGLAARRPSLLQELPTFPGDSSLDKALTGGDLCLQICCNDPQVAVHAIRNLSRIAFGRASIRWSQLGFGRTSSTSTSQSTPRNLMGFKDGTNNLKAEDAAALKKHVWVDAADGPAWLAGGSYLVARKIRITVETWDHQSLREQERVIGRTKREGAPLSGGTEFTPADFSALGRSDAPLIDQEAHVRLAAPVHNDGVAMLRRGYNYVEGNDALGRLQAGLMFLSYQRSPEQFIRVQQRLADMDGINEYIRHLGSGVFAVPPGVAKGGWWGQGLFG